MKIYQNRYGIFFCVVLLYSTCFAQDWTWLFKTKFSIEKLQQISGNEISVTKENLPFFNQLIISWNAFRPKLGHFSFYAQIRDAETKKWHDWHHLMDWGAHVQKSFYNRASTGSINHYVRLEAPPPKKADAVKIKVKACNGADLLLLKGLAANITDFDNFKHESVHQLAHLPSIYIAGVPRISQMMLNHPKNKSMCSPTASSMLVSFFQNEPVDPLEFAQASFDHGLKVYGSWSFNTAHAFGICNGKVHFFVMRLPSFKTLHTLLKSNIPVVVSVRGFIKGAPKPYKNGHLLLVVGWDKEKQHVLCHDPAFFGNKNTNIEYDIDSFLIAWERSKRLAYVAESVK